MWGKMQMNHWNPSIIQYKKYKIRYILHPMDVYVKRKKCVYFLELYFEIR